MPITNASDRWFPSAPYHGGLPWDVRIVFFFAWRSTSDRSPGPTVLVTVLESGGLTATGTSSS